MSDTHPKDRQCDCHSYNWEIGKTPEAVVNGVSLDACIADTIRYLWDNGVSTQGSCCGHNRTTPSIVLADGEENYSRIRKLIAEKDDRYYELSQWRRVLV